MSNFDKLLYSFPQTDSDGKIEQAIALELDASDRSYQAYLSRYIYSVRDVVEPHGLTVDLSRQPDVFRLTGDKIVYLDAMHVKFADCVNIYPFPAGIMCRYPVVVPKWDRENLRNDWFRAEYIEHFFVSPKARAHLNTTNPELSLDVLFLNDHIRRSIIGVNTPYQISPPASFMGKITKRNTALYSLMGKFNGTFSNVPENYAYEITDEHAIKSLLQAPYVAMPYRTFCEYTSEHAMREICDSFAITSAARDYADCGGYNFAMAFSRGVSCITAEKVIQVSLNSDGALDHWKEHQRHIPRKQGISAGTVLKNMLMSGVQQLQKDEWLSDTPEDNTPENILRKLRFQSPGEKELCQEMFNLGCTRQKLGEDDLLCTNIETARISKELVPETENYTSKRLVSCFRKDLRNCNLINPQPLPL
jgi:hypothetical protein